VALAISALVLVALYGAVVRAAAVRERAAASAARVTKARLVLLGMAGEIEAALAPDAPAGPERFVVVAPGEGKPPWAEVRLATAAGDDVRVVGYRVEAGTLMRREGRRFAPADTPEPAGAPALGDIRSFRMRCFDGDAWRTTWTGPALPRTIELALGIDDGAGGIEELSTAVALALGGVR